MRYKCTCQYDGSHYAGWQRQLKQATVQGVIENALAKIYQKHLVIHGASRTDKGVHAYAQVFHFDAPEVIPLDKLAKVINRILPADIYISEVEPETQDFHSRYSCIGKAYVYRIDTGEQPNVFKANYAYFYGKTIALEQLELASRHFIGIHDFKAFMASGSDKENTIREIYDIRFSQVVSQGQTYIEMYIHGSGFLYNMVRIIMGTLLDYWEGRYTEAEMLEAFKSGNRHFFRRTAPACGLYLKETFYASKPAN